MESYIKHTLGLHVDIRMWEDSNTLPDELQKENEYVLMEISNVRCLVIKKQTSDFQLSVYQKERLKIQEFCKYPQVLCFDRITSYQRKCLIESGQSFVVPDNQLYMPFLGIALQEHFKSPIVASQQLTAMAQYILLFFLYDNSQEYHSKLEISQKLDINLMNVSRGVQELEELSLLVTRKKGRSSMVTLAQGKKELFEKAQGYLRNPVQKRMFVKAEEWLLDLPKAGMEANPQNDAPYRTRAIEKRVYLDTAEQIQSVDPAWDIGVDYLELEVWRYDPKRYTDGTIVDSISHALSLMGDGDTAVEVDIDKLFDS